MTDKNNNNNNNNDGTAPQMWKTAENILSDAEIKRLACCYFHSDHTKIDYTNAALDYGSSSGDSFRVMLQASVRKVRNAQANGGVPLPSPVKARGGGKRKREDDGEPDTPKREAGRLKKVKASEAAAAADAKVDEGIAGIDGVKEEAED